MWTDINAVQLSLNGKVELLKIEHGVTTKDSAKRGVTAQQFRDFARRHNSARRRR